MLNLKFSELALDHDGEILGDDQIDEWADDAVTLWKAGAITKDEPRRYECGDTVVTAEVDEDGILTIYDMKIDRVLRVQRKTE